MNWMIKALVGLMITMTMACSFTKERIADRDQSSLGNHSFSSIDSLMENSPRPIAVFLHTNWCKYCQSMLQTTFQHPDVVRILNEKYYFISFDAEQKEDVYFRGQRYAHQPSGRTSGAHALAKMLGTVGGVLAYPSFVLLNSNFEIIFQHNSFMSAEVMQKVLIEAT